MEKRSSEEFHISLDCDKVLDFSGMRRSLGVAPYQEGHADLSLPVLSSQRKGRGGHWPSGLFHLGVLRAPGLRPIIMGRGVPRHGLCAAAGGSDDGLAGAPIATRLLFQGECHRGKFYRLEFTVKGNSLLLPNHPEAVSVYDSKSADEAKIANCNPETIERFRSWGRMDGANKHLATKHMEKKARAGSATDKWVCWAPPLRLTL